MVNVVIQVSKVWMDLVQAGNAVWISGSVLGAAGFLLGANAVIRPTTLPTE